MEDFERYIAAFERELNAVIINDVSPDIYCQKYLSHLLNHKAYYLRIYADVFNKLITARGNSKETIALLDYGAGNGLFGIFAKFCKFKKVFINDICPSRIMASRKLASQLNINIDGYITGDIIAVKSFFKNETPDAVAGTDVIEHIYNLEVFFKTLHDINPGIISVFTTASNPHNYFKVKALQKMQVKDELEGGTDTENKLLSEENTSSFLQIREKIIRSENNTFSDALVFQMAKATRGKDKNDIIQAVKDYASTKVLPVPPGDTNTCNPIDGSWAERILPLATYRAIYADSGFTAVFSNGFYNEYDGSGIKKLFKKSLNLFIRIFGDSIAPYIVIVGRQTKESIKQ